MVLQKFIGLCALSLFLFSQNLIAGPQFKEATITFVVKAGEGINIDLRSKLIDPSVAISSWDISADKPSWLTLNKATGFISGTPSNGDLGSKAFKLSVFSGEGADFNHPALMKVVAPPVWTQSPLNLGTQKEDQIFNLDLNSFVSNPSGGAVQFSAANLPQWLSLNPNGSLSGTPARPNVGAYSGITFTATSSNTGFSASVQAFGEVLITLDPPSWKVSPLILADGFEDSLYTKDISSNVTNPENGVLKFTLVNPPAWIQMSSEGVISGTPRKPQVGAVELTAHVTSNVNGTELDGGNTLLKFNIIHVNHPPNLQQPISFITLGETFATFDLKPFASDPDDDKLTFKLISGPKWALLTQEGALSGIPEVKDEGLNTFNIEISDTSGAKDTGKVQVTVTHKNKPPVLVQPISFTVVGETLANLDLSKFASDQENDPITFEKISGPAWAQISSVGLLSGTPQIPDEGINNFSVRISDGKGGVDTGDVVVTVTHKNKPPVIDASALFFTVKEREVQTHELNLLSNDPDNDPLTFTLVDTAPWVSLSGTGKLILSPLFKNIGDTTLKIKLSDGKLDTSASIQIKVVRDARPPEWTENPVRFSGKILTAFKESLSTKAKDLDGLPLAFSKVSGPSWLTISSTGALTGTPPVAALGDNNFVVSVKNDLKSADADLIITLTDPNKPPVIDVDALDFTLKERETETQNLTKFVKDPEGDTLTFTLMDNPGWAILSAAGSLVLKPGFKEIGDHLLKFEVKDVRATVSGVIKVKVLRDARPPVWNENPINLSGKILVPYSESLAGKAQDLDGIPLTFSKVSGPSWLTVEANGALSGTPPINALGKNTFVVSVKNDLKSANADLIITMIDPNKPPVINSDALSFTVKERETQTQDLTKFVVDPEGDVLTFTLIDSAAWVTLSSSGSLVLKPEFKNIGDHALKFEVKDVRATATGTIKIKVLRDARPPEWTENPVRYTGKILTAFSESLSTKAKDLDALPLTFTKVSGPSWLTISSSGALTGTPPVAALGDNNFVVSVKNDLKSANADLIITLSDPNKPPVIDVAALAFTVKERETQTQNLTKFVKDPEGDALTFTLIDNPAWVTLSSAGSLVLKPEFKEIGDHALKFEVKDVRATVAGIIQVKVLRDARPPVWSENPVKYNGKILFPFSESLASKAKDLDGLPLTFSKVSGPAWLIVDANGSLSGTPPLDALGGNTFDISVKNDLKSANADLIITLIDTNKPPVINTLALAFTVKERETLTQDMNQFVTDPDGDKLTFTLIDNAEWVTLSASGSLVMKPEFKHIGDYALKFEVKDVRATVSGTIKIKVIRDARPPVWTENPIRLNGKVLTAFKESLSLKAKDLDGLPITFTKISGASWLTVSTTGELSGTPPLSALGDNNFVVSVKNDLKSANADLIIKLTDPNQPPVIDIAALAFTVKERETQTQDLTKFVKDPEGDVLTFTLIDNPSWVTLSSSGSLVLKPEFKNIGDHAVRFEVKDIRATVSGIIKIKVLRDARPPVWNEDPINLTGILNKLFSNSLSERAKDLDGLPLTYSKVSGPNWLFVNSNGALSGIPDNGSVGQNAFVVRVSNDLLGAEAHLNITITDPNKAPEWIQNPILLGDITAETLYNFDLSKFAKDADGDKLTFKKVAGPSWLSLSNEGQLFGTPLKTDTGEFTAIFETSDGKLAALVDSAGKVIPKLNPNPVIVSQSLVFKVKEREILTENLNQEKYVKDPQGRPLSFTKKESALWLKLDTAGNLKLSPQFSDIGKHIYTITITNDVGGSATGLMFVEVERNPRPPVWLQNPISYNAAVDKAFSASLADKAKDNDNLTLTFSKASGPSWLSVNAQGQITGTPLIGDLGLNQFTVKVSNDLLSAVAQLSINVSNGGPVIDTVDVTEPVPGARVENLWVIDGTACESMLYQGLEETISDFYRDLRNAQVVSAGLYMSSYPNERFIPVPSKSGSLLIDPNNPNILADWKYRTRSIQAPPFPDPTSVIYSLFKFQKKLPSLPVYHKTYLLPEVPMEVAFASDSFDYHNIYSRRTPQSGFTPSDYVKEYKKFHQAENKSIRISGMFEDNCDGCRSTSDETIVKETNGVFKLIESVNHVREFMSDYTKSVIFRAYVSAKNHIKLSKIPASPKSIVLTLAGNKLPGNTGSVTDKWYYEPSKNEIVIHWNLIDINQLKAGDRLLIQYTEKL